MLSGKSVPWWTASKKNWTGWDADELKKGRPWRGLPFVFDDLKQLFFLGSLFGGLKGIDFLFAGLDFEFLMRREIAQAVSPLPFRRRVGGTDGADGALDDAVAALTFLDDVLAGIAFENAAALGHEGTFGAGKNSFTFHRC
jgi:hypothetical protein